MSIYKRGNVYWYKFMWQGEPIRKSTKQGNDKTARKMEAAHRTALAQGLVGIREKKSVPTLADFLKHDFLPFVEGRFVDKPNTRDYYEYAAESLSASKLGKARLDEINSQQAAAYCAAHVSWSPSTINRDLRTLRRALNLAVEWGKLDRAPKIGLARGERQRERVLSADEVNQYLKACRHPDWHDAALVTVGTGMRPDDEVCSLRWEFIQFNGDSARIRLVDAKTLAGRRVIPIKSEVYKHFGIPDVCAALKRRYEAQGCPCTGWVFPRPTKSGHLTEDSYKGWHAEALQKLARAHAEDPSQPEVAPFEPYCLRHTFLTWLAPKIDIFALARLAGHASIRTTQRYVHPAEKTLEDGLAQLAGGHKIGHTE
jgi:integrase